MFLIAASFLGCGLTFVVLYIIYLRGEAAKAKKDVESFRALIKLFSERQIVATLSEEQFREILAQISQIIFAALNTDPDSLN